MTEWVDRSQLSPAEARRVLLRLPDPEVLESIGNLLAEHQFISPYGSVVDALFGALDSKQPKLLPYIARGVFRNEDADTRDFEWASPGKINRSMESLSCMLRLTYVMEEFSPEVRAWARAMLKSHFLPANERRELGRTWWKANEKAIIAGNYAAVRAGISPAQGMPAAPVSTLPEPGDAKRVSPNARPTTSTNSSNGSPVLGLPTVTEGTAPRPLLWLILGGITAVLAGMAVWLGMRSRGRKE